MPVLGKDYTRVTIAAALPYNLTRIDSYERLERLTEPRKLVAVVLARRALGESLAHIDLPPRVPNQRSRQHFRRISAARCPGATRYRINECAEVLADSTALHDAYRNLHERPC
jgi:hypothetical protein